MTTAYLCPMESCLTFDTPSKANSLSSCGKKTHSL